MIREFSHTLYSVHPIMTVILSFKLTLHTECKQKTNIYCEINTVVKISGLLNYLCQRKIEPGRFVTVRFSRFIYQNYFD